jgi:hypothetical protein
MQVVADETERLNWRHRRQAQSKETESPHRLVPGREVWFGVHAGQPTA